MGDSGHAVLVELFDRDRNHAKMRTVGRTAPASTLTSDGIMALAKYSLTELNGSNFFLLWRVMKEETCTTRLGSGLYGSVFRVCKDDGCASCIAVKFGLAVGKEGTALVEPHAPKPDGVSSSDWAVAQVRGSMPLSPHLNYDGVTWDEVRNTQTITRAVYDTGVAPHVMRYLHHFIVPRPAGAKIGGGLFLFVEYVPPWMQLPTRIASFHDLLGAEGTAVMGSMDEATWKGMLFQAVYTIAALQATFPSFRHNDAKPDNWALAPWDGKDHTYSSNAGARTWRLPKQAVMIKLIDFGLVHSASPELATEDVATAHETSAVGSEFVSFGVVPEPCALYDLHLLLGQIIKGVRAAEPYWRHSFETFLDAAIPPRYFEAPRKSDQFRLTIDAQREINADMAAGRALAPRAMLDHPYFATLVAPAGTAAEFSFA